MAIAPRDAPRARTIRWSSLAVGGLATAVAGLSALGTARDSKSATGALSQVQDSLQQHKAAADQVALECHLRRFSDEASLDTFPMEMARVHTRLETECARRVTDARAALIEDTLKLKDIVRAEDRLRISARRRSVVAGVLAAAWVAGIYLAEIRPRARSTWKGAVGPVRPGSPAPPGGARA